MKHDTLFGNLIAELVDKEPRLRSSAQRRYAATATELEQLLHAATAHGSHVVIIVDGLDHIGRVRSSSRILSDEETDIIERIAALKLPDEATVIVGSQPGSHLDSLVTYGYRLLEIPPWTVGEMATLLEALGLPETISYLKAGAQSAIIAQVTELAEGNPLCGTLLSRELAKISNDGNGNTDLQQWLSGIPAIHGQIHRYYAHLYQVASADRRAVAELLAVLDFSVTKQELREMVGPVLSSHLEQTLTQLRPILKTTVSGGGIRIFHESFRRFILDELGSSGRETADILGLVITYLENKGFQQDSRAYRYLLPLLLRAGRHAQVLELIDPSFVPSSLAAGQPLNAIQCNITLAARTAAALPSWEHLVVCIELLRQLTEASDSLDEEARHYWQTMVTHRGPHFVTERLLYEGRPTLDKWHGLLVCERVDRAGEVPPWSEYLHLAEPPTADTSPEDRDFFARISLARLRGNIRVNGWKHCSVDVASFLAKYDRSTDDMFLDELLALIHELAGIDAVEDLLNGLSSELGAFVATRYQIALFIAKASSVPPVLEPEPGQWTVLSTELLRRGIDQGHTPPDSVIRSRDPAQLELGFSERRTPELLNLTEWFNRVRLAARKAPDLLETEKTRLIGKGWYRSWLRFVILIAMTELKVPFVAGFKVAVVSSYEYSTVLQSSGKVSKEPRLSCAGHAREYMAAATKMDMLEPVIRRSAMLQGLFVEWIALFNSPIVDPQV